MIAVFSSGGKQYLVKNGDKIKVEKLDMNEGETFSSDALIGAENGSLKKNVKVKLEVIKHFRDDKVIIFKKSRRKNFRRKNGHRQPLSLLKVVGIE